MASPTDVANLWTWLKAEGQAYAAGAAVTTWEDSSSNNKDGTSGGGATLQTGVLSGKAVVRFDGLDDFFSLPDLSALTAGTGFVVVKVDTDPPVVNSSTGLWKFDQGASSGDGSHYPWTDGIIYDRFGSTARKTTVNPTSALTSWRLYEVVSAAGDWRSYLDGTQLFTTATNTVQFPSTPTLGKSFDGSVNYFLDGDIAEFILYSSALSTPDRQLVEQYVWDTYAVGVDNGIRPAPPLRVVQSNLRLA